MAFTAAVTDIMMPPAMPGLPAQKFQLADQGAAGTEQDCTIGGYKYIRGFICIKSGLGNSNTFQFVVRTDDAGSQANPDVTYTSPTLTFVTNDVNVCQYFFGVSCQPNGFRYFKITGTNSGGTAVYDAVVEVF